MLARRTASQVAVAIIAPCLAALCRRYCAWYDENCTFMISIYWYLSHGCSGSSSSGLFTAVNFQLSRHVSCLNLISLNPFRLMACLEWSRYCLRHFCGWLEPLALHDCCCLCRALFMCAPDYRFKQAHFSIHLCQPISPTMEAQRRETSTNNDNEKTPM